MLEQRGPCRNHENGIRILAEPSIVGTGTALDGIKRSRRPKRLGPDLKGSQNQRPKEYPRCLLANAIARPSPPDVTMANARNVAQAGRPECQTILWWLGY